ncbi:hypothetical protein J8F10_34630 [Gemmata sp. G18]|uniref:Uncharacterized protein n=1 Tax=Gemmata palustris TaxID=2822762 RepID=A0ABS5C320_9BACT|nr:hypothetical protein [Gemmata palustris]MBP3960392.1 hypothetical protein [Gemmata palustris]
MGSNLCSDDLHDWLVVRFLTLPEATLADAVRDLEQLNENEKRELNQHMIFPFGADDIRAELLQLIATHGECARVTEFDSYLPALY